MSKAPRWAVALDFDGTIISEATQPLMPRVADRSLQGEALAEMLAWRAGYMRLFESGQIRPKDYRDWLIGDLELYIRHGLTRRQWEAAIEDVQPRPGLLDCLHELHAAQVPICVVSAATADFIEHVFARWGARHFLGRIYATRLIHDEEGRVSGYDWFSIVDSGNKGDWCKGFADHHGIPYERILGIGDSVGDATLGHERIGIAESEARAAALRALGIMHKIVVINGHFRPVHDEILRHLGLRF